MFTRTHAQASPSITLEQGITRLRPARAKVPLRGVRDGGQPGVPFPTDSELKAATILASIAFATLLAVSLALYLLSRSSRWELISLPFRPHSELPRSYSPAHAKLHDSDPYLMALPEPRVLHKSMSTALMLQDPSERYLSYLPHSGFHNQRIALENALILAYILNRTLLIPTIRLGEPPIRYRPSHNLRVDVALSTPIGLDHCQLAVSDATFLPEECTDFGSQAHVPWEWLVGVQAVTRQHNIKTLTRWDLTDTFLDRLRVAPTATYFVNDTDPYQHRFFDRESLDGRLGSRYKEHIDLTELATLSCAHRLLQFGTLFGTTRVHLAESTNISVRRDIRKAMAFTSPALLRIADGIRDSSELGGQWSYAAVHLRLGDGAFANYETRSRNARLVWWKLVRALGMTDEDALKIEVGSEKELREKGMGVLSPPPRMRDAAALRTPHPPPPPLSLADGEGACLSAAEASHPLLQIPLYVATDKPRHSVLSLFTRTFSCVYFLSNFSSRSNPLDGISGLSSDHGSSAWGTRLAESLDDIYSSSDLGVPSTRSTPLGPFFPAFLDAIVASKARVVIGTPGSTFSRFVEDVLWRHYHGWEIVQRGETRQ